VVCPRSYFYSQQCSSEFVVRLEDRRRPVSEHLSLLQGDDMVAVFGDEIHAVFDDDCRFEFLLRHIKYCLDEFVFLFGNNACSRFIEEYVLQIQRVGGGDIEYLPVAMREFICAHVCDIDETKIL